jgi:hypothetical protein
MVGVIGQQGRCWGEGGSLVSKGYGGGGAWTN